MSYAPDNLGHFRPTRRHGAGGKRRLKRSCGAQNCEAVLDGTPFWLLDGDLEYFSPAARPMQQCHCAVRHPQRLGYRLERRRGRLSLISGLGDPHHEGSVVCPAHRGLRRVRPNVDRHPQSAGTCRFGLPVWSAIRNQPGPSRCESRRGNPAGCGSPSRAGPRVRDRGPTRVPPRCLRAAGRSGPPGWGLSLPDGWPPI